MATRDQRRALLVPRIARAVRTRDFRTAYSEHLRSRHHSFIPVLRDDPLSYLFDRLRDADHLAIVVVEREHAEHEIGEIIAMMPASDERVAVARQDDQLINVGDTSTVEMFVALMRQMRGRDVVLRRTAVRLLDDEGLEAAR